MSQSVMIRRITIGGFRGILTPLEVSFVKGKSPRSMFIYGRNGTGKSSITDAWEWLQTGRIEHLRREGAQESAYPHIDARPGETFLQVEFSDESLGTVRMEFDHDRVTKPIVQGDLEAFRSIARHPCQLRFEDLTRFVYRTKAEKYDALAQLMGFTPQVEIQKALRRVERQFRDLVEDQRKKLRVLEHATKELLSLDVLERDRVLSSLNEIISRHGLSPCLSMDSVRVAAVSLRQAVEHDPRAHELADLLGLAKELASHRLPKGLAEELSKYSLMCSEFQQSEYRAFDLLRLTLYEEGEKVLREVDKAGGDTSVCPLCGSPYEGDLVQHLARELAGLTQLKRMRDEILQQQKRLATAITELESSTGGLSQTWGARADLITNLSVARPTALSELPDRLQPVKERLAMAPESLSQEDVTRLESACPALEESVTAILASTERLGAAVSARREALEKDTGRTRLVNDHQVVTQALVQWDEVTRESRRLSGMIGVQRRYDEIVADYIASSIDDVQRRFDTISGNVAKYFGLLERENACLSEPALRLMTDQDRAVELEVGFYGERICPAYKFLSESQLNSFGLAIFLASIRQFNPAFPFLVLDDIINSFDGHKRPLIIELLGTELSDHQVLLLTHDNAWYEELCDKCPGWIRRRFSRLERGSGPIDTSTAGSLDRVKELLQEDRPADAGRKMGEYLERHLQELSEFFQALVPYNRRNEYTLDPLITRYRARVGEKLGTSHPLYVATMALEQDTGFRNVCAHWKNPAIPITSPEIRGVVAKWETVQSHVACRDCNQYAAYDQGRGVFACRCGNLTLQRAQ